MLSAFPLQLAVWAKSCHILNQLGHDHTALTKWGVSATEELGYTMFFALGGLDQCPVLSYMILSTFPLHLEETFCGIGSVGVIAANPRQSSFCAGDTFWIPTCISRAHISLSAPS